MIIQITKVGFIVNIDFLFLGWNFRSTWEPECRYIGPHTDLKAARNGSIIAATIGCFVFTLFFLIMRHLAFFVSVGVALRRFLSIRNFGNTGRNVMQKNSIQFHIISFQFRLNLYSSTYFITKMKYFCPFIDVFQKFLFLQLPSPINLALS